MYSVTPGKAEHVLRTDEHALREIRKLIFYVVILYSKTISKERLVGEVSRGTGMILKTVVFKERELMTLLYLFIQSRL